MATGRCGLREDVPPYAEYVRRYLPCTQQNSPRVEAGEGRRRRKTVPRNRAQFPRFRTHAPNLPGRSLVPSTPRTCTTFGVGSADSTNVLRPKFYSFCVNVPFPALLSLTNVAPMTGLRNAAKSAQEAAIRNRFLEEALKALSREISRMVAS
ncbi:hypothetical protein Bbelb_348390 [Branchiostoma belcheri]|nr:hypothetical protein Bbelb_348390 [Branchiostoma belcheri]